MTKVQANRLRKLGEFLVEHAAEMRGKFWMTDKWFSGDPRKLTLDAEPNCGTAGCAIGWCPVVFPRKWGFVKESPVWAHYWPVLRRLRFYRSPDFGSVIASVEEFFGVEDEDASFLFAVDREESDWYNTSPSRVGKRILRYLAEREEAA